MGTVRDGRAMIAQMDPLLDEARWCFVAVTPDRAPEWLGAAIGTFREDEGVSAIVPAALAPEGTPQFARITLQVHSDLEGVGLTAAVANALAEAGIACNMVAALHHDYAFVPAGDANRAVEMLEGLQAGAQNRAG
ncbi:ACT domain-containing protein [Qipengyuania sp. 6B39]|uniref:ACT domain-containing protein n=1 Tax=Qipengyuania proteolytica TaxID=2867239 RepID=UPI001C88EC7D|nr:ACT domain-containing protein [Qipengyuania proteolytica]MBX7495153.1 ACT domain-containing protein [Qipengyuania proteolytica]